MNETDVMVVGAGLAGLYAARRLADAGLRVSLVDRKPSISYGIHTTGIFVRRTFEEFDLPANCLGPAVRHVTLYSPRCVPLELESSRAEFRIGRMGRLYSEMLSRCREAGVQILLETAYEGCTIELNKVGVRLRMRERAWTTSARFLIGADGARSRVAADLGLSVNRKWIVGVENVYRDVPLDGPPRLHCFLDPRIAPGYLAWIAQDGDEVHVGVGGDPSRFRPLDALREFRGRAGRVVNLDGARFVEHRGGRIPVGGVLSRIVSPHGLLLGDAAGAVSPLTAGGLDPCLRLSQLAAEVTVGFLESRDPAVLKRYNGAQFRSRFRGRRMLRRALEACRSPWMVEAACGLLRLPLCRELARQVFFGDGSFPDVGPKPVDAEARRDAVVIQEWSR